MNVKKKKRDARDGNSIILTNINSLNIYNKKILNWLHLNSNQ